MDINSLLAKQQVSLMRARFATAADMRGRYLVIAADLAKALHLTSYPHRQVALEMLI